MLLVPRRGDRGDHVGADARLDRELVDGDLEHVGMLREELRDRLSRLVRRRLLPRQVRHHVPAHPEGERLAHDADRVASGPGEHRAGGEEAGSELLPAPDLVPRGEDGGRQGSRVEDGRDAGVEQGAEILVGIGELRVPRR